MGHCVINIYTFNAGETMHSLGVQLPPTESPQLLKNKQQ